ncbi:ATP-binding protein [Actinomadura meridiana]|uniref:histidine kinase n=1 Tax=Actinomadura meridiana TaxID=559626 RepID=A0ABP8BYB5_9ACTN
MTSLRVRLAAAFTAVVLLAALMASGISYVLMRRVMLQRAQDAVLTDVRNTLARQVPPELPPDVTYVVSAQLEAALRSVPGRKAAAVPMWSHDRVNLPPRGKLDVPVTREFAERAVYGLVFQRVVRRGKPYLLVGGRAEGTEVVDGEGLNATPPVVFVSASLSREAADLRTLTTALLIADAFALVFAVGLALLATRGVLRPVRRLGAAARALGEGALTTRVEERGSDELADLARTFNRTAGALEGTVTELRAMEAASRRFVADVSHELRTPLTSMIAMTDVMAQDGDGDGQAVRLVAQETRRLGQLVEHLIEISRFDAGAAGLVLDDVDIAAAITATLKARGWRDEVKLDGPAELFVRLDPRRFDVIIANLVGNALKHGRPPASLHFQPADTGGVRVVVADRGPGLPHDLVDVVFDRFVKAEAARSRSEGSGLGLSIAKENAVLHGGTLEAANAPEGGAVFTLWLPDQGDEECA